VGAKPAGIRLSPTLQRWRPDNAPALQLFSPPAANRPRAARRSRPKAAGTLGSFKAVQDLVSTIETPIGQTSLSRSPVRQPTDAWLALAEFLGVKPKTRGQRQPQLSDPSARLPVYFPGRPAAKLLRGQR